MDTAIKVETDNVEGVPCMGRITLDEDGDETVYRADYFGMQPSLQWTDTEIINSVQISGAGDFPIFIRHIEGTVDRCDKQIRMLVMQSPPISTPWGYVVALPRHYEDVGFETWILEHILDFDDFARPGVGDTPIIQLSDGWVMAVPNDPTEDHSNFHHDILVDEDKKRMSVQVAEKGTHGYSYKDPWDWHFSLKGAEPNGWVLEALQEGPIDDWLASDVPFSEEISKWIHNNAESLHKGN